MSNRYPFQFDNFIEAGKTPAVVLDLSVNKPQSENKKDSCLPLLENISSQLELLLAQEKKEKVRLVKMLLHDLSPQLLEKQNLQVICRFIEDNFPHFALKKVLDFYFNPAIIYQVRPLLEKLVHKKGYNGRILLHKDKNIALTDCKIRWQQEEISLNIQEKIKNMEALWTGEENE